MIAMALQCLLPVVLILTVDIHGLRSIAPAFSYRHNQKTASGFLAGGSFFDQITRQLDVVIHREFERMGTQTERGDLVFAFITDPSLDQRGRK